MTTSRFVLHVESWKCTVFCKRSCGLRARIKIHHGKTQLWNRGGQPAGVAELTLATQLVEPDVVVWKSDPELPLSQNGLRVLGAPIGTHCISWINWFRSPWNTNCSFREFRGGGPPIVDVLWSNTRQLRMIQPDLSLPFAERHDDRVWDCLASFLHVPAQLPHARTTALMPLSKRGLGLGCAVRARHAAHHASWADSLPMVRQRHP